MDQPKSKPVNLTSDVDQSDPQRPIRDLIESACQRYGIQVPRQNAIIKNACSVIPPLIEKMSEKEFYQWFCPVWQSFEYLYSDGGTENDWAQLVGQFASLLTEYPQEQGGFNHPSLRAMCVSFMMNSLNNHPLAQSYALRMLLNFAIKTELCKDETFVHWLINFMKHRIDNMISNYQSDGQNKDIQKQQSQIFTIACITFFDSIPVFDTVCALSILQFYDTSEFTQILQSKSQKKEDEENKQNRLKSIAAKTFNTALLDDSFFTFEIIRKTKLIYNYLNENQRKLLQIFVDGEIRDFEAFVKSSQEYINQDKLNLDKMKDKILVLSFVSLAHGKSTLAFTEAMERLNLDKYHMKRLCVRINSTDVAKLAIDSVNEQVIVEYCQPRLMTDDVWNSMASRLQNLAKSLLIESNK
ncbi:Eukaryotic translation initiation factor 3 subunit M [Tritrichomonas musculus]|uniref:Eukaryotic translation initiation factor 3 subunit M n=1 Tax=Tritrichomonas musculus TaxID=1915356 RepID=A0ABR2IBL9_9EUKA